MNDAEHQTPGPPVSFGYKQMWHAVPSVDALDVSTALGMKNVRKVSWSEGVARSYKSEGGVQREVFVSPPVRGWSLAVGGGGALPDPSDPAWVPFFGSLSRKLGHVQFFSSHRTIGYAAWAKAIGGDIVRAYVYADGVTVLDIGSSTREERELGFDFIDETRASASEMAAHSARADAELSRFEAECRLWERLVLDYSESEPDSWRGKPQRERPYLNVHTLIPDQESVMLLASRWSIDPTTLPEISDEPGLGLLGLLDH
jgi:hypothetical protein